MSVTITIHWFYEESEKHRTTWLQTIFPFGTSNVILLVDLKPYEPVKRIVISVMTTRELFYSDNQQQLNVNSVFDGIRGSGNRTLLTFVTIDDLSHHLARLCGHRVEVLVRKSVSGREIEDQTVVRSEYRDQRSKINTFVGRTRVPSRTWADWVDGKCRCQPVCREIIMFSPSFATPINLGKICYSRLIKETQISPPKKYIENYEFTIF